MSDAWGYVQVLKRAKLAIAYINELIDATVSTVLRAIFLSVLQRVAGFKHSLLIRQDTRQYINVPVSIGHHIYLQRNHSESHEIHLHNSGVNRTGVCSSNQAYSDSNVYQLIRAICRFAARQTDDTIPATLDCSVVSLTRTSEDQYQSGTKILNKAIGASAALARC